MLLCPHWMEEECDHCSAVALAHRVPLPFELEYPKGYSVE